MVNDFGRPIVKAVLQANKNPPGYRHMPLEEHLSPLKLVTAPAGLTAQALLHPMSSA